MAKKAKRAKPRAEFGVKLAFEEEVRNYQAVIELERSFEQIAARVLKERGVICFDACRSLACEILGMTEDEARELYAKIP